jgi:ketosteroid isomerase-like protein
VISVYRMIVRSKARRTYRRLNADEYEAIVRSFSPSAALCMAGTHPLGGRLDGIDVIRRWFQRLFRLFPDLELRPLSIVVGGWPWDTVVATRFRVSATLPDGRPYANEGMQLLRLRWGRVVEDLLYEDTQALAAALDVIAANGDDEATAPPLASITAPGTPTGAASTHRRLAADKEERSR